MTMTEKQKKFCDYFIETGNATKAAIFAGYSQKTAKQIGQQNLTKLDIKAYIDERLKQLEDERIADANEVMKFLTSVMRGEVTEPVAILDGDGKQKVVNLQPNVQTRKSAAVDIGIKGGGNPYYFKYMEIGTETNKAEDVYAKREKWLKEKAKSNAEAQEKLADHVEK